MRREQKLIIIDSTDYRKLRAIGKALIISDDVKTYRDDVPFSVIIKYLIEKYEKISMRRQKHNDNK